MQGQSHGDSTPQSPIPAQSHQPAGTHGLAFPRVLDCYESLCHGRVWRSRWPCRKKDDILVRSARRPDACIPGAWCCAGSSVLLLGVNLPRWQARLARRLREVRRCCLQCVEHGPFAAAPRRASIAYRAVDASCRRCWEVREFGPCCSAALRGRERSDPENHGQDQPSNAGGGSRQSEREFGRRWLTMSHGCKRRFIV